tara:strand:+ start:1599 stop:1769 length:171 start_codon:yes stop_codon:yes gene_type:complete
LIEDVIPGFENFNEKVKDPSGFELPNGARKADFTSIGGKAKFTINSVPDHRLNDGE